MKKTVLALASLLLVFAFTSCSTMDIVRAMAESSSSSPADPEPKAAPASSTPAPSESTLRAQVKAEWDRYALATAQARSFPAGAAAASLGSTKLQGGEWAIYRILENGKTQSVMKMAIVGREGEAWIYEIVSVTEKEITGFQEAVKGLEETVKTGSADKAEVLWIKVRDNKGEVQKLEGSMLGLAGNSYKAMLTANSAKFGTTIVAGGAVTVPAGTFASTWKVEATTSKGRGQEASTAWVSSVVPLWHLIRSVNKTGNQSLELVDFGTTGYVSLFGKL